MRLINSSQIQAEKKAAQNKLTRVGIDHANFNDHNDQNVRDWKDLKYFSPSSLESENEFQKLSKFKQTAPNTDQMEIVPKGPLD